MNKICSTHPSPQSSPLRGERRKPDGWVMIAVRVSRNGSPRLFTRGEEDGEEFREENKHSLPINNRTCGYGRIL